MLSAGSRIGPYDVVGQIGVGGMGEVYQATDSRLKRAVAIKILPAAVAADADRLARFRREAEVLAALNHPNIAAIYGLEETESGIALVMELVEGPTLADRIQQRSLPTDEALQAARQIADALEAAHDIGIVHRDLKPANIKVRPDGTVKVLDFGLAKALEPATATINSSGAMSPTITTPAMTHAGMILGTAAYMSPEQARGRVVDRRTDIWAFGCVLFEMLTGRRAFNGEDVTETLAAIVKDTPPWSALPPLPPLVGLFLKQCLEKDPRKRLGDIRDMRLALSGELALAQAAAPRHLPSLAVAGALVLATAAIAAVAAIAFWPRSVAPPLSVTRFEHPVSDLPTLSRRLITISADGRRIVYQTRAGIFVRSMDEVDARLLVPGRATGVIVGDMVLSPDGQWLAYVGSAELSKIPISGGAPVPLANVGIVSGASWTSDGAILYGHQQGIMRVPENGGSPEVFVQAGDNEQMHLPQLLPDGDSVLFTVTKDRGINRWMQAEVVVQSRRTGQRTVLAGNSTDGRYLPSGHLIFARGAGLFGSAFDVKTLALTGATVSLLQDVQLPVGIFSAGVNYDVSSDGTLIYVKNSSSSRSPVWVDRRSGTVEPITTMPPDDYEDPRLSPDGGRVVVRRDGDLWIYELASGRNSRLTSDGGSMMAVWDPTGTRIAYSSVSAGNLEAWLTAADGSQAPRALTQMGGTMHVDSWSPDGRIVTLHFHGRIADSGIYMLPMDQEGARPQRLSGTDPGAEGADFSPDGTHVAFLSTETGTREIYVRPYPGPGGQTPVSVNGGAEPVWAANGDLFYRSPEGNKLFTASTATRPSIKVGQPVLLLERPFYVAPSGSPRPQYDVSADGQRVLMLANAGNASESARSRLVVVQNWFEEIKRAIPATQN